MVQLERLNGSNFFLNAALIEIIEMTPDTVITLTNGHKYLVKNSAEDVIEMIKGCKRD